MSGVSVTVRDQNNNPIEGANVTIDGCTSATQQTNVSGVANISTCFGWGGPFGIQVGAPGYELYSGTINKPFYPWQVVSQTVYLMPKPVAPTNGTNCPVGYSFDQATGNCIPVAPSNYLNNIVDDIKTYATDIVIGVAVGLVVYALYRVSKKRVVAYLPMMRGKE